VTAHSFWLEASLENGNYRWNNLSLLADNVRLLIDAFNLTYLFINFVLAYFLVFDDLFIFDSMMSNNWLSSLCGKLRHWPPTRHALGQLLE